MLPSHVDQVVKVNAITRSAMRRRCHPEILQEAIVQQVRLERIKQAQEEEKWIDDLITDLIGTCQAENGGNGVQSFDRARLRSGSKWIVIFLPQIGRTI